MMRRWLRPLSILAALGVLAWLLAPYAVARFQGKGAVLKGRLLVLAPLPGANLRQAVLAHANLSGANLKYADLREASLRGANLTNANLDGADLRGADLRNAVLKRAVLSNADLSRAKLADVDLGFTLYNKSTRWPAGFNPVAHGASRPGGESPEDMAR